MKIALITGVSSGLGYALTHELVAQGLQVIGVARREATLNAMKKTLGDAFTPICTDVSTPAGRETILQMTRSVKHIDYLIHNAASVEPRESLACVSLSDMRAHMAINLEAPLFLTQQLLPQLIGGRVLHISTGVAHIPFPGAPLYSISKAALFMLYQNLKAEINNVCFGSLKPGVVATELLEHLINDTSTHFADVKRLNKMGTVLTSALVAQFIAWVLLKTSDSLFSENEWDVYATEHQSHWSPHLAIPNPF